jgi:hypothetical protein
MKKFLGPSPLEALPVGEEVLTPDELFQAADLILGGKQYLEDSGIAAVIDAIIDNALEDRLPEERDSINELRRELDQELFDEVKEEIISNREDDAWRVA